MNKALFLDRDGTINVDYGYVYKKEDLKFIDSSISGIKKFQDRNYIIIVITNQSGIGRGLFSKEQADAFNFEMVRQLRKEDIHISAIYMCPHKPDDSCSCRKPSPELILKAAKDYDIDLSQSIMFGDKNSDIEAGTSAGVKSYLITQDNTLDYWAEKLLNK